MRQNSRLPIQQQGTRVFHELLDPDEESHRLTGAEDGSVSMHAYSPPLWRLGQYSITDTGVMRRVSVSYADELRPLETERVASTASAGAIPGSPPRGPVGAG